MRKSRFILIAMVLFSWSSLLFIGRRDFKRFLPAAIFMSLINIILNDIAEKRRWWRFFQSVHPKIEGSDTWVFGLFFPVTLWILKCTYGNIKLFIKANFILHILFVSSGLPLLKKIGIVSLVRLNKIHYFLILFIRESILYAFQFSKEYIDRREQCIDSVNGKSQDRQVENLRS
ncbi:hypothetical protein [Priestia megaterium]|uniref:hypothetical protein n=1 Tax=Priestia megaterium TaxID=1404 RepID=UPI003670B833